MGNQDQMMVDRKGDIISQKKHQKCLNPLIQVQRC